MIVLELWSLLSNQRHRKLLTVFAEVLAGKANKTCTFQPAVNRSNTRVVAALCLASATQVNKTSKQGSKYFCLASTTQVNKTSKQGSKCFVGPQVSGQSFVAPGDTLITHRRVICFCLVHELSSLQTEFTLFYPTGFFMLHYKSLITAWCTKMRCVFVQFMH